MVGMLLWMPLSAWAGPQHDAVLDLLGGYESPVREADLKALGAGIDQELMDIAADPSVAVTRRGAALYALQYFPTEPVRTFVEKQIQPGGDALLRRKAAYSLAAWGSSAVPALTGALGDGDVQLRIAAASALGKIADPAAQKALTDRLATEPESAVKDAISKSLGGSR